MSFHWYQLNLQTQYKIYGIEHTNPTTTMTLGNNVSFDFIH